MIHGHGEATHQRDRVPEVSPSPSANPDGGNLALRREALAVAVRIIVEIEAARVLGKASPDLDTEYERMWVEVERWKGTKNREALAILSVLAKKGRFWA